MPVGPGSPGFHPGPLPDLHAVKLVERPVFRKWLIMAEGSYHETKLVGKICSHKVHMNTRCRMLSKSSLSRDDLPHW